MLKQKRYYFFLVIAIFCMLGLFSKPVNAAETMSLSMSDDGLNLTASSIEHSVVVDSMEITVNSTARDGYILYMNDSDADTALRPATAGNPTVISSIPNIIYLRENGLNASEFPTNSWGYSTHYRSADQGAPFFPIPALGAENNMIASTLKPAVDEKIQFSIGVGVDATTIADSYSDELVFTLVANSYYMRQTTLEAGPNMNADLRSLTGAEEKDEVVEHFTYNPTGVPDGATTVDISNKANGVPVYAWYDDNVKTIYYWTKADEIFMNENSVYAFADFKALKDIDVVYGEELEVDSHGFLTSDPPEQPIFITKDITSMVGLFSSDESLESVDLTGFTTDNVTDMSALFYDNKKIKNIDLSGFNTSKVTNMSGMFSGALELEHIDISSFDTSRVTEMEHMFYYNSSLVELDVAHFVTNNVTNMNYMFAECSTLTELDVSHFVVDNVTTMAYMFYNVDHITELDVSSWNVGNVQNFENTFNNIRKVEALDVSHFDTSSATTMRGMFGGANSLTSLDVSHFVTDSVTDMCIMFYGLENVTALDVTSFNTENVTNMGGMFSGMQKLESLDVSGFDTSKVTDFNHMFYDLNVVDALDVSHFNTSSATDMSGMFLGDFAITTLDLNNFDTSHVTNMENMFYELKAIETLDVSSFDTSNVTNMNAMFKNMYVVKTIYASPSFVTDNVTTAELMFSGDYLLVGGSGTTCNSIDNIETEYARIDVLPDTPGYFTAKPTI